MKRKLILCEEGADAFLRAMLEDTLECVRDELAQKEIHPEDKRYGKKLQKSLIRVINHFSLEEDKIT